RHGVEHQSHRVDGGLVRGYLVAAADPSGRRQRGGLRDPDDLECEVPVGSLVGGHSNTSRMWLGSAASKTTRWTAEWYGRSSPCSSARRRTSRAESTPSTVIPLRSMSARASSGWLPVPTSSPYRRFRPPRLVTRTSPRPAR